MTFGQLIFLIIIAILAFFVLKISMAFLIIVIVIIVVYYLLTIFTTPRSNTYVYAPTPENFDANIYAQKDYNRNILPTANENINTLYGPIQEYYDEKINTNIPTSYDVPSSTSEYCFKKHMEETGDVNSSIANCTVPSKIAARYAQ